MRFCGVLTQMRSAFLTAPFCINISNNTDYENISVCPRAIHAPRTHLPVRSRAIHAPLLFEYKRRQMPYAHLALIPRTGSHHESPYYLSSKACETLMCQFKEINLYFGYLIPN